MIKVKQEEGMGGMGRFRINQLVIIWMILTFGTVLLLSITANQYTEADNKQGTLAKKILQCHKYADQMQNGSDILTNAIWRFAATEETAYAEEYLSELLITQSRDRAIELLQEEDADPEDLDQLQRAKDISAELRDAELYCMHLIYSAIGISEIPEVVLAEKLTEEDQLMTAEEKKRTASAFLFGKEYLQSKNEIAVSISRFGTNFTESLEQKLQETTSVTQKARTFMFVSLWILLVWAIVFWILFRWLIVQPMQKCLEELREEDREKIITLRGPYELRRLIDAFNTSMSREREKTLEIYNIKMKDPVTGGYTSQRFDLEVEGYLKEKMSFMFVSMDIKRFKVINELYGEKAGNQVLKRVYQVIGESLKPGEFAARSRADIFNIVLLDESQPEVEKRIGEIEDAIKAAFRDEKWNKYRMGMNCGVYLVQGAEADVTSIRGRANVARKKYKTESGLLSPCVFYSEQEAERLINEQFIENQMEKALAEEEFQVYLQPKVQLKDEKVVGAEALVRWKTTDGNIIPPSEFIPLFEVNGFILQLDYYMFRHVCALLQSWIESGKEPMPISVNLSREHIKEAGFIRRFKEIQEEYHIPPQLIEFEVTEEIVVENLQKLKEIVTEFNDAGFRCSMDDFGCGYSSLNVLKEINLDVLKLDRAFFTGAGSERGKHVIRAVLQMAQQLHMQTVAEGVETRDLVDFLKEAGCDMVQGYVFYRPMTVEQFENNILAGSKSN